MSEPCAYCVTNDLGDDCWHTPEQWTLMRALARHVGNDGDEYAIYWEEDADGILSIVGPEPYIITAAEPVDGWEFAYIINGVLCAAPNGYGEGTTLQAIARIGASS